MTEEGTGEVRRSRWRRRWQVEGLRLGAGERVLHAAPATVDGTAGVVAATTDALVLLVAGGGRRRLWHDVDAARWDDETRTLHVRGVDGITHLLGLARPRPPLAVVVRDRVQASVVATRHVQQPGGTVRVVVRRVHGGPAAGSLLLQTVSSPGVVPEGPLAVEVARARRELAESVGLPPQA